MFTEKVETIADVTYKEVMRMWNLPAKAAQHRLILIRKILGKKRFQKLSVNQFCEAEGIKENEFYCRMQ